MHSGLTTLYPNTNAVFSPDDKYVVTGAGASEKGGVGRLSFLKKDTLEEVKSLVVDAAPVRVAWHTKINQVSCEVLTSKFWCIKMAFAFIDHHWTIERSNSRTILSSDVSEWSEAAFE